MCCKDERVIIALVVRKQPMAPVRAVGPREIPCLLFGVWQLIPKETGWLVENKALRRQWLAVPAKPYVEASPALTNNKTPARIVGAQTER